MNNSRLLSPIIAAVLVLGSTTIVQSVSEPKPEPVEELEKAVDVEEKPKKRAFVKPPEGKNQPWRLLRGLQILQDDLVAGKARSEDAYKLLLLQLAKVMDRLDDSVWNHERNIDALATYIILGGATELGYKALQKTSLGKPQTLPLLSAIAYAERDVKQAEKLMAELDFSTLPLSMSAHFILARSMIASSQDLNQALIYLNEARRSAPGTLVEEAALRRAIRVTGETKDFEYFRFLTQTYLRRFRKSYYILDFLKNFSFTLVRMTNEKEEELILLLEETFRELDVVHQVSVASYVARNSTISGKKKLSYWASEKALEQLRSGSRIHARMQMYLAAIEIVDPEKTGMALKQLEAIEVTQLDQVDKQIHKSATLLGEQILQDSLKPQPEAEEAFASALSENSILMKGEKILSELDEVLKASAK